MKITAVENNNHKRTFEVRTRGGSFSYPYALAEPTPRAKDKIVELYVDKELSREAFTYRLQSGAEGSLRAQARIYPDRRPP